jgi:hypothetical protein
MSDETAMVCARKIAKWKPFGPGRVGRYCRVILAPQSDHDRPGASPGEVSTSENELTVLVT